MNKLLACLTTIMLFSSSQLVFAGCEGKEIKIHPIGTKLEYTLSGDNVKDSPKTGTIQNSDKVIGKFTKKGGYKITFYDEKTGSSCEYQGKATEEWLSCDNEMKSNSCTGSPTHAKVTSGAGHIYHDVYLSKPNKHIIQ